MYELKLPHGWQAIDRAEAARLLRPTTANPERALAALAANPRAVLTSAHGLIRSAST